MKFGIALLAMPLLLGACGAIPSNFDDKTLAMLAPDVPEISAPVQDKAADEIEGGACPALAEVANQCLITRDQSRVLKGQKIPK